jgi:hypothetical protein
VLVLHVGLNVLLCAMLQQCNPMQEANVLLVLHGDLWITTTMTIWTAFQLACALSAMKSLKFGSSMLFFLMT